MMIHPYPSPNHDLRRGGATPSCLVMHYTECDLDTALSLLTDPSSPNPVSAHYVIDGDGRVFNLVPDDRRAWHCGRSAFGSMADLNSHTIGIELVNDGCTAYPQAQMAALVSLGHHLIKRHRILPRYVLGHSDIAPHRKEDPGRHFDWTFLYQNGVGLMPRGDLTPRVPKPLVDSGEREILYGLLAAWGYDRGYLLAHTADVVRAFQGHYDPHGPQDGQPYGHHIQLLNDLNRSHLTLSH